MDFTESPLQRALRKTYPNAQWVLRGDNYDGLVWLDSSSKPSELEVQAAVHGLETNESIAAAEKAAARQALLDKLGITEDEARLLLS